MVWKRALVVALVPAVLSAPLAGAVGVSPAFVDVRLDKGRPAGKFIITNPGKSEERYRVKMIHFEFLENGALRRIPPNSKSLAPWMRFNPKEVVIPPKSKRAVRFVVVPRGRPKPGQYWAAMELESLKASIRTGKDDAGRAFRVEVIPTVLVPVFGQMGNLKYSGTITSVKLVHDEKAGATLKTLVTNTGTGRLLVNGKYSLLDESGKEVVAGPCGYGYVLPGTKREFSAPVKKASLAAGTYTARVRVAAGQLKAVMSNEQRVAYKPSSPPQKKPDQKVSRDGKSVTSTGGSGKTVPTSG